MAKTPEELAADLAAEPNRTQSVNDPGYIQSQENARARNTERLQDIDRREAAGESNRQDQARFKAESAEERNIPSGGIGNPDKPWDQSAMDQIVKTGEEQQKQREDRGDKYGPVYQVDDASLRTYEEAKRTTVLARCTVTQTLVDLRKHLDNAIQGVDAEGNSVSNYTRPLRDREERSQSSLSDPGTDFQRGGGGGREEGLTGEKGSAEGSGSRDVFNTRLQYAEKRIKDAGNNPDPKDIELRDNLKRFIGNSPTRPLEATQPGGMVLPQGSPQNTGMGALSQQVIQQQGQGGGVQTAQDVAAGGKYTTGQSVKLDSPLPGGQESTKVYALGGGIALPDGVGMSSEDFEDAYKQLNPGKSMTDAVQGLAREPGPAGAAARNILKDIGASGGASLSPAQKRQIEQQLSGRGGELLRGHAQSMDAGITSGSNALRKEAKDAATAETARKAAEEKNRGIAYDAATKRFESEPGRSLDALYKEEQEKLAERTRVMEGGDAKAKVSASGPDARTIANDEVEQRPTSLPGDSPAGFGFDGQSAIFTPPDNVGPMPVVVIKDADGNPKAAVYLENPDDAKRLPPGTPFVTDDGSSTAKMFNIKGTPGRPSGGGGGASGPSGGSGTTVRDAKRREGDQPAGGVRQWENPGYSETRKTLQTKIDRQYENTYDTAIKDRDESLERLNSARVATPPNPENVAAMELRYDQKKEALEKIMAAKPEVTEEQVEAQIRKERDQFQSDATAEQRFRFNSGDPDVVRTETDAFLPEGGTEQRTPSGTVLSIDGQNIPMTRGSNGIALADPQDVGQIIALESNSRGNVLTKGMGDSGTSAATSETYKKTNMLRSKLQNAVTSNNGEGALVLTQPGGASHEVIYDAKTYLQNKYPFFGELPPAEQSKAVDGFLLGMGFLPDSDPRAIAARDERNAAKSQYDKDMEAWELTERNLESTANVVNDASLNQPGGLMRSTGEVVSEASWLPDNFAWAGGGQGTDRGQEAQDELAAHRRNRPQKP